ncbi:MAG: (d)CMP kinase [Chthoniobacterales bacterium]|nr:(d)CMP kinase [Chthoniobacterales bacterium]
MTSTTANNQQKTLQFPVITIDGPAASGKTSVARAVAQTLGCCFVSSGVLYRAAAWLLCKSLPPSTISSASPETITSTLLPQLNSGSLQVSLQNSELIVLLNEKKLDEELYSQQVNSIVSRIAAIPEIRHWTLLTLRSLANLSPLAMEGRDIGSAVFPESPFKFYLDALPEIRRQRRSSQGIQDQIAERDRLDSSRRANPLTIPPDATIIDTSFLTLDQVVQIIIQKVHSLDKKGFFSHH